MKWRKLLAQNYDRRACKFGDRTDDDFDTIGCVLTGRELLLDVGCGAGGSLKRFVRYHGVPARAVGVDIASGMLERADQTWDVRSAASMVH